MAGTDTLRWSAPDPTIWVATRGERFIGFVEVYDGHFVANDTEKSSYRAFRSLRRAKRAIEAT